MAAPAQGFTALNSAGNYEFVTATNAVPATGGTLNISGAGAAAASCSGTTLPRLRLRKGQSTYQVVLVPQYTTATLGAGLTASPWNGSTGGVLALDTSSTLTLGGATVSVDGLGFRGGAGMQLSGWSCGRKHRLSATSPATYTGAVGGENGVDASKGEGIAGTPAVGGIRRHFPEHRRPAIPAGQRELTAAWRAELRAMRAVARTDARPSGKRPECRRWWRRQRRSRAVSAETHGIRT